jgi:hypothetical protein
MKLLSPLQAKFPHFYILPLFVAAILENLIASTWNVDPYHEGALFPTAVGLAEGLSPFREISQQYGFLGPLIVSIPLRVFGNYLIVERLFGLLLILLIALITYLNLKKYTSNLTSGLIALLWLTISPIWSWPFESTALSGGYWPNHLGIFLVLTALYLYSKSGIAALVAGFLVLLSSQARTEFIFVWLFMSISIFIKEKEKRLFWAIGSFFSAVLIYCYLAANQSINDWFQQTFVVWTMNPPGVPEININFFIFNFVNFFGVSVIGLTLCLSAFFFSKNLKSFGLAVLAQTLLIVGFLLIPNRLKFDLKIGNYNFIESVRYSFRNTLFAYINFSMIVGAILLLLLYLKYRKDMTSKIEKANPALFILLSATFGILSLFHNFNPDYTQMIWPIFGLLIVILVPLSRFLDLSVFKEKTFRVFVIGLLLASHGTFVYHATSQKFPYQTQMLSGLYGNSPNQVRNLDASFKVLSDKVTPGKMLMVCQSGLLSTNEKGFLGSDKWTWNQQPSEMITGRLNNLEIGSTILACYLNSEDSERIKILIKSKKIEVLNENNNFTLYRVVKSIS